MQGPALLMAGIISFSLLDAGNKLLSGTYSLSQTIVVRYVVLLALLFAARGIWRGAGGPVLAARPKLHWLRASVMIVSAACFFLAFRHIPLAEGYLVFFTSAFITLVLVRIFLGETVPRAAWFWCLVGFAGVAMSAAPRLSAGGSVFGYAMAMCATLAFAVTQTLNRVLRSDAGVARMLFYPAVAGLLFYSPLAVRDWIPTPALDMAHLALNGIFAGGGIVFTAMAYRVADAARLGPFTFAALPFSVALDYIFWGHPPDLATLVGGAVVILACVMSERTRLRALAQGMPAGKTCCPSSPSGSGTTVQGATGKGA